MRINLIQGTPEWLAWRSSGIGGSDASCVLGENPWKSQLRLWQEKTGQVDGFSPNEAMRIGTETESEARLHYNFAHGTRFVPACYESDDYPFMRCSVDGILPDGSQILEIKVHRPKTFEQVRRTGAVPKYYNAQLQHNMFVSGSTSAIYYAYCADVPESSVKILVQRDDEYIRRLILAECEFWTCVLSRTPPESIAADYVLLEADDFIEAAEQLKDAMAALRVAKENEQLARAKVLDFTDDGDCMGGGLKIQNVLKSGSINWKKVQLAYNITDEQLEVFRGPQTTYWMITEI